MRDRDGFRDEGEKSQAQRDDRNENQRDAGRLVRSHAAEDLFGAREPLRALGQQQDRHQQHQQPEGALPVEGPDNRNIHSGRKQAMQQPEHLIVAHMGTADSIERMG